MKRTTLMIALLGLSTAALHAEIQLIFTPLGTSEVVDYPSNAYAQLARSPQGMYDLDTDTSYGSTSPFAPGAWAIGSLALNANPTLSGIEHFTITGVSGFDFNTYVDGASFTFVGPYSTSLTGITGSVSLNDGTVTALSLAATVNFEFGLAPGAPYVGSLSITATTFDLFVDDDTIEFDFGSGLIPLRYVWDVSGGVTTTAVPEPSLVALLVVGLGAGLLRHRFRMHRA